MNSSESSVIVLDSDDEDHQQKSHVTKNVGRIQPSIQNDRNTITINSTVLQQLAKLKDTAKAPVSSKKPTNTVSIIPLKQLQTQKSVCNNNRYNVSKSPQLSKMSPTNSPRNSPNLKVVSTPALQDVQKVNLASTMVGRKNSPKALINSSTSGKQNSEIVRNVANNSEKSSENNRSISPLTPLSTLPKQNALVQPALKRKIDNTDFKINPAYQVNRRPISNYKRIKPTTISSSVNSKWNQLSQTITIEDDDELFESKSKSKLIENVMKSRSNSLTSSSALSPSPSVSSTAASPQSQSSPTTPSPSLKEQIVPISTSKFSIDLPLPSNDQEKSDLRDSAKTDKSDIEKLNCETSKNGEISVLSNGNVNPDPTNGKQINEIIPAFNQLMEACRKSDNSIDMEILIEKKLLKYYHSIHPDFITSKSFKKTVESITNEILETPNLVYIKLKTIVEELKSRKNSKVIVVSNDGQTSTGNDEIDEQVRKLNKGLRKLKHIIAKLEEQEVDFDSEFNSAYLKGERFKKRACEIYEKICDLTGESKHAQRTVRKPIVFDHTSYPKINKAIETFVNKTKMFPDFYDILTILEHCNKTYKLDLTVEELKRIAQDAFVKVGKLLQNRRKTDLYETVLHYTEKLKDPALEDSNLNSKLNENKKHYGKINALIQKYAREQDTLQSERLKTKDELRKKSNVNSSDESSDKKIIENLTSNQTDTLKEEDETNRLCNDKQSITEETRNTPSCSNTLNDNKNINLIENNNDKSNDKIDEKNYISINSNDEKTNIYDSKSSSNLRINVDSIAFANVNHLESAKKIENSITSKTNERELSGIKIVNVESLSEKSKSSSLKTCEKNGNRQNSTMSPSSIVINDIPNNTNRKTETKMDEIILLDDDV